MNNTFQTIRMATVFGIAFLAFAQSAFAAPIVTPVMVTDVTSTSAVLDVRVLNAAKNTCAWFEWTTGSSMSTGTAISRQCFYGDGSIKTTLNNLNPGSTYSYRAVAIEGGVTVSSSVSSFSTLSSNIATTPASVTSSSQPAVSTQIAPQAVKAKTVAPVVAQKNTVTTSSATPAIGADGFTNGNSAAIIGAGNGILPITLIGWIGLLVMTLLAVIFGHMIYESAEKRRIEREQKELEDEKKDEVIE